jgi:hypothetical protein
MPINCSSPGPPAGPALLLWPRKHKRKAPLQVAEKGTPIGHFGR